MALRCEVRGSPDVKIREKKKKKIYFFYFFYFACSNDARHQCAEKILFQPCVSSCLDMCLAVKCVWNRTLYILLGALESVTSIA